MVEPKAKDAGSTPLAMTVLPVGGSRNILYRGGPHPWVGKPSFYFSDVEAEDDTIVRAVMLKDTPLPYHAATVTCLKVGSTKVHLGVGNKVSSTNKRPGFQKRPVLVHCSTPARVAKVEVKVANQGPGAKEPKANSKTGRVTTYSYRDFRLITTIKDQEGRTMDNVTSLELRYTLSEPAMATLGAPTKLELPSEDVPSVKLPVKGEAGNIFVLKEGSQN